ncbi:MAG: bifunctional UDP-N-acetylglucosamine diphosphorylase/glucosamine-1-phosphate N-acetyltransferase GlmU [Candidatus Puniceispirillaceae bacterium]
MKTTVSFTSYILSAGHGKRMQSDIAKPLHEVGGKAMLGWVIETAYAAGSAHLSVVTSPKHDQIEAYLAKNYRDVKSVKQPEALGTGHGAQTAYEAVGCHELPVLVLFGDTPLLTPQSCQHMAEAIQAGSDVCVLGFETDEPNGYGRLKTDEDGRLIAIIEDADASEAEKQIRLVNAGVMAFSADVAKKLLGKLSNDNAQGEYYLTDLVALAVNDGRDVTFALADQSEVMGVNSRSDLAKVEENLQNRLRQSAMRMGATLRAPETVFLSSDTIIEKDVVIEPHVMIAGGVEIKQGALIRAFSHLEGVIVGQKAIIGPYARLRPGTIIGKDVKIGNFVETKKAQFEDGAKANHLSYVGDAMIGAKANIGAGTITCNYDGYDKFQTTIGKGAFIGSNTALVAPVTIGDGAIIGAGSTITKDVAENDLSLTRAPQKTIADGGQTFRSRKGKGKG